ncbi:MAG: hypothetical protein WDN46_05020 [Methylocella sp.]
MTIYVVGYDLHPKEGQTYTKLENALKTFNNPWHCLDSTWLVKTDLTAVALRDFLWQHMYVDDQLLVVTYSREAAWKGFSGDCATWLNSNL